MNCKYCNAELPEEVTLCPVCGKEQQEAEEVCTETTETCAETAAAEELLSAEEATTAEADPVEETVPEESCECAAENAEPEVKEPAKPTPGKIALAVVAGIVVLATLISLIVSGTNAMKAPKDPTEETVAEVVIPSNGDPASILCKASYTVSDEEAMKATDVVVATIGDKVLTNGELQAYYWQEVYLFLQEYGNYAPYIGLDLYSPLDKQLTQAGEMSMSWQQFFLDSAIYSWHNYQSMALEGEAQGYQMPENRQAELDGMPAELEASRKNGNYDSIDAMIRDNVGAACSEASYLNYVDVYYHGLAYYYDYCEALNPTDEEVDAFFTENEEAYAANGLTRETKYVDVRHVLLQPEGGETGENGYPVFTDEAWEACRIKVEEIYNAWQEGDKSEDSFAQLAKDHSVDGNASTGGLYENVYEGMMVEEFENWCFDEARQVGDHGLVKTAYGYHIMFFSGSRDAWYEDAKADWISENSINYISVITEKYPINVDYSKIALGELKLI